MEIIEKAMERRGASIVWAGRGYMLKGETPCGWRGFRGVGQPRANNRKTRGEKGVWKGRCFRGKLLMADGEVPGGKAIERNVNKGGNVMRRKRRPS